MVGSAKIKAPTFCVGAFTFLSPLKIWQDGRGDLPYKDSLTYAEYMSKKTGYPLATGYGAVTYFYDAMKPSPWWVSTLTCGTFAGLLCHVH